MKLYCLSSHPNKPCYVLKWREMTIMLDCGLSALSVLNFLPIALVPSQRLSNIVSWMPRDSSVPYMEGELKDCCGRVLVDSLPEFAPPQSKIIDFSEVDVILLSNYLSMLALPFITEETGFNGVVYCTEPTLQIGQLFLEELAVWIEQSPKSQVAVHWKEILHLLPLPLSEAQKPRNWRHIYSLAQLNASLSRVKVVGYDEKLDIYGALTATPVSSGYCLGSANWVIQSDYEKVAYVSGSTTLTTHPKPLAQSLLSKANALIMTSLTQTTHNPDTMIGELCAHAASTLRSGGCVLLPCYPSGLIYDLFECLSDHLYKAGLGHIPLFFISPVADTSLAYSNILAEWLATPKQNKVYTPEEPFPHALLMKNERLKHFKGIGDEEFSAAYRQPCVVFCGHPSLRFGDAVHFMELWSSNPLHCVIFTEPDFPYTDALAPFQPVQMKVAHCTIDTSLDFNQATKLIRELKPQVLVIPELYTKPSVNLPDFVIDPTERPTMTIKMGEVLKLPVKRKHVRAFMTPELAKALIPSEVRPGITLAAVSGSISLNDNNFKIEGLNSESDERSKSKAEKDGPFSKKRSYEWGWLDADLFMKHLEQEGIKDATRNTGSTGSIIHLADSGTLIYLEDNSTHIICEGDTQLRLKLKNALLSCLNKLQ